MGYRGYIWVGMGVFVAKPVEAFRSKCGTQKQRNSNEQQLEIMNNETANKTTQEKLYITAKKAPQVSFCNFFIYKMVSLDPNQ